MPSIYIITSKTSGKSYIGQTNATAEKRWKRHLIELRRREGCRALYSAIKKYGERDFEIKTLKSGDFTRNELNELEKKYIQNFNSLSPNGYNLMTGGMYCELSEETKQKMSELRKGRKIKWAKKIKSGMKKRWQDPEYRKQMISAHSHKRGKYKTNL